MLKIKDSVDLKELENFGFKQIFSISGVPMQRWWTDKKPGKYIIITDDDSGTNRKLLSGDWEDNNNLNILYDLIQANLVEKVDD